MDESARQTATEELYAFPGHLLWRASARVGVEVDRILPGTFDIHAYAALLALADQEPQSQSRLARMTGTSGTTLTAVAHTLQRDGLVERVRNPEDRRSYSLTRTAAGRDAVREWAPHVDRLEHRLSASLTAADRERLHELLRLVMGEDLDERTPGALRGSTGFLVTKAHHRAHRDLLAALSPLGIEPRHFGTLRALRVAGAATQGDVAVLLDVSPATVVQIVDHLERCGLVTRERDAVDRRAYRLHVSGAAEQVIAEAGSIAVGLLAGRVGAPGSPTHRDLVRLLRRLLAEIGPA